MIHIFSAPRSSSLDTLLPNGPAPGVAGGHNRVTAHWSNVSHPKCKQKFGKIFKFRIPGEELKLSFGLTTGVERVLKLLRTDCSEQNFDFLYFISVFSVFSDEILSTSYNFSRQLVSGAASASDSDYYFLDEDQNSGLDPVFLASMSSNNVSVSAGTRAHLHCTIENAHRKTVMW